MSAFLEFQPKKDRDRIAHLLRQEVIHLALLLHLDFADAPVRISNRRIAFTDLQTGAEWGAGYDLLVGLPTIDGGDGTLAPFREYRLGLPFEFLESDDWKLKVIDLCRDRKNYTGRDCGLYGQVFDPETGAPVGYPFAYDVGQMDRMTFKVSRELAVLSLTSESLLARKGVPPYGKMTFHNQKDKYPGDLGMQFTTESDRLVEFGAY